MESKSIKFILNFKLRFFYITAVISSAHLLLPLDDGAFADQGSFARSLARHLPRVIDD